MLDQAASFGEKELDSWIARWKVPAAVVLSSWILLLLAMHRTVLEMVHTWYHSRTYSHCFLILPLFGFLVWVRRRRLQAVFPAPNYWGMPLFAALALVWVAGNLGEVRALEEFALVAMLVALVWTLLGV